MLTNNTGCALCNSTWGNHYETIENEKLFFCCDVCANLFQEIIISLKNLYSMDKIYKLELQGNPRLRTYEVKSITESHKGKITFENGKIFEIIGQS